MDDWVNCKIVGEAQAQPVNGANITWALICSLPCKSDLRFMYTSRLKRFSYSIDVTI